MEKIWVIECTYPYVKTGTNSVENNRMLSGLWVGNGSDKIPFIDVFCRDLCKTLSRIYDEALLQK